MFGTEGLIPRKNRARQRRSRQRVTDGAEVGRVQVAAHGLMDLGIRSLVRPSVFRFRRRLS